MKLNGAPATAGFETLHRSVELCIEVSNFASKCRTLQPTAEGSLRLARLSAHAHAHAGSEINDKKPPAPTTLHEDLGCGCWRFNHDGRLYRNAISSFRAFACARPPESRELSHVRGPLPVPPAVESVGARMG
eukprot:3201200-Rhodomonas_salina.1